MINLVEDACKSSAAKSAPPDHLEQRTWTMQSEYRRSTRKTVPPPSDDDVDDSIETLRRRRQAYFTRGPSASPGAPSFSRDRHNDDEPTEDHASETEASEISEVASASSTNRSRPPPKLALDNLKRDGTSENEASSATPRRSSRLNPVVVEPESEPEDDEIEDEEESSPEASEIEVEEAPNEDESEPEQLITDPESGSTEPQASSLRHRPPLNPTEVEGPEPVEQHPSSSRDAPPRSPTEEGEKLCRICFGGVDEESELGRLFSPCKCKGSMRHVHVGCLNQWRRQAAKQESFYRCDQCHYKYSFRRTWWAGLVMNEFVLTAVTLVLFMGLIFLAGFLTKLLLMLYLYFNPMDPMEEEAVPAPAEDEEDYWDALIRFDPRNVNLFRFDRNHFFAGFFLVGVMGMFNVILNIFIGPFAPMPRFGGVVRIGGGGGNDSKFPSLLMIVLVVIGAARTAWAIYKSVKAFSRRSLEIVETSILEVQG